MTEDEKDDKQIILNLEDIVKRAQQITVIVTLSGSILGLFWYYAITQPFELRDKKDKDQDHKIELILDMIKKREESSYAVEKDLAILKTQFTRFEDSLVSIRDFLKSDYRKGSEK